MSIKNIDLDDIYVNIFQKLAAAFNGSKYFYASLNNLTTN
jgi:hypothetical protein